RSRNTRYTMSAGMNPKKMPPMWARIDHIFSSAGFSGCAAAAELYGSSGGGGGVIDMRPLNHEGRELTLPTLSVYDRAVEELLDETDGERVAVGSAAVDLDTADDRQHHVDEPREPADEGQQSRDGGDHAEAAERGGG